MSITRSGSCICEAVKFKIAGEPEANFVCYCLDCRKNSGHLGQLIGKYASSDIIVDDKDSNIREWIVDKTESGFPKHKVFCSRCGCTLWTKPMKFNGEKMMVRTTLLDEGFDTSLTPSKCLFGPEKEAYLGQVKSQYL